MQEFDDAQVKHIVEALSVPYTSLAPATRTLLRVPLHLHLFAQLPVAERGAIQGREIASLQDLYALLWRHVVVAPRPDGPSETDRAATIAVLTDHMHRVQRTSASQSLFLTPEHENLMGAVRWLASAGILVEGHGSWAFLHQTFFDYCYARQFVGSGRRLSAVVRSGDQGLFVRPLLVQVLAYLRGSDPDT